MKIIERDRVKPAITEETSEIKEILTPQNSSLLKQSLVEIKVAPGKITEEHFHLQTEEICYVLRGQGRIWVENESRDVKVGDGIAIPSGKKHKIENTGGGNLLFLCCCAPAYTPQDTVFILK